ncbi:hypothetical protein ACROYT_G029913 [Oculina patagonica]
MADDSPKATKMARILAIVHIFVGFLLFCLGIVDLVVGYFWSGYVGFGIWIGVWMCITGSLGIRGTRKERTTSRNAFAGIFMGFSITSAVFGGIMIICYSLAIVIYRNEYKRSTYDAEMALSGIILTLGIVEIVTGIWTAVCLCLMKPCTCCYGDLPQQGQAMYTVNPGYAMSQAPGCDPVAIPMQAGGGMVTIQTVTSGAQGGQPQMVMVPVSSAVGYQPQLVQAAPAGAIATGYQPEMPPSYEQGHYMTQQNAQVPVKT